MPAAPSAFERSSNEGASGVMADGLLPAAPPATGCVAGDAPQQGCLSEGASTPAGGAGNKSSGIATSVTPDSMTYRTKAK